MILKVSWKNLWSKPLNTALSVILLTSSVAIITLLLVLQEQFENKFYKNIEGIDLVMGAQGSPLQLILSSVYHIDTPTGNISYKEAKTWMNHPYIEKAIPLAFGDNYKGYKIVGTTSDYIQKFNAKLAQGDSFEEDFDVVIGAALAENLNLKVGDEFFGTHGESQDEAHIHEEYAYRVVGILEKTGKVIDNLVLCTIESVWLIHDEHHHHDHEDEEHVHDEHCNHDHDHEEHVHDEHCNHDHEYELNPDEQDITAVLLKVKNKMAFVSWPRLIPQNSKMQVASPTIEINRLFSLFGIGIELIKYLGIGIMCIAGGSIFIALYNKLKDRKYEFAIMRINGATKSQLFGLVLFEGLTLSIIAFFLGSVIARVGLYLVSKMIASEYKMEFDPFVFLWSKEGALLLGTIFVALLASVVPAIKAYRLDISKTLNNI
ncbi:MAG: ABC transporter permease [Bacteroidota bacterium]|nr:ABC transporter permease [Bacteroidota bacterium]